MKSLFSGVDTSAADEAAKRARQDQSIQLDRQRQDAQNAEAAADDNLGKAARAPKGRRLLLAATGEQGVSSNLGGT